MPAENPYAGAGKIKKASRIIVPLCVAVILTVLALLYFAGGFFHSIRGVKYDDDGNELWHYSIDWKGKLTIGGDLDDVEEHIWMTIEMDYYYRGQKTARLQKIVHSIQIEDGVTAIGKNYFSGFGRVKELTLPPGVVTIKDNAFAAMGLERIYIPASVSTIDGGAFAFCDRLTEVQLEEENPYFSLAGNALMTKDGTALVRYFGRPDETSYTVPDGITELADRCFAGLDNLKTVELPEGLRRIGDGAFQDCGALAEIAVPEGVAEIGDRVFKCCYLLEKAALPDSAEQLGNGLFLSCQKLTEVRLPSGMTAVTDDMFDDCESLTELTVPATVQKIGRDAFCGSGLREFTVPEGVTYIGTNAFLWCHQLTSLTIPASVTGLGLYPFGECEHLKNIYFGGTTEQWQALLSTAEKGDHGVTAAVTVHCNE